jgi:hypothetical protein
MRVKVIRYVGMKMEFSKLKLIVVIGNAVMNLQIP